MGFIAWLLGPNIPLTNKLDENEWNKHLSSALDDQKIDLIKVMDERSQKRYDKMDIHIQKLKEIKARIKQLKKEQLEKQTKDIEDNENTITPIELELI